MRQVFWNTNPGKCFYKLRILGGINIRIGRIGKCRKHEVLFKLFIIHHFGMIVSQWYRREAGKEIKQGTVVLGIMNINAVAFFQIKSQIKTICKYVFA